MRNMDQSAFELEEELEDDWNGGMGPGGDEF